MIIPTVDANKLRAVIKDLKVLDENVIKELRKDLRAQISPVAQKVQAAVPTEPPLSGFRHNGRTAWGPVRTSVSFTPGRSRKTGNHLVSIRVTQQKSQAGFYIAELKWSGRGNTPSGRNMVQVLNQRFATKGLGGRFAYNRFRTLRPDIVNATVASIKKLTDKVSKRLGI